MTTEVQRLIAEAVAETKISKCQMCQAFARLSQEDRDALYAGYDGKVLTAKKVAEILSKTAGFTGALRHGSSHFREGHER